jgi:formylglycine-generating enzyme required for sulfatase activity
VIFFAGVAFAGSWFAKSRSPLPLASLNGSPPIESDDMVWIVGGRFLMGSDFSPDPASRPQHHVAVRSFWIDRHEVTNAQFAQFVAVTGYLSTAERQGHGWVFEPMRQAWMLMPAADWRHPFGPHSSIAGQEHRPVVLVSWYDAAAYARWAGKRLPTEAEWEYAARGGSYDADFPWGRQSQIGDQRMCNAWQGWFPERDLGIDGARGLADIGSYPPNRYGLHDMSGNVWEWCADWYSEDYYRLGESENPTGPQRQPTPGRRVQRGGSWLSADNVSPEIQVWARSAGSPDVGRNHLGFRCARDADVTPVTARR